MTDSITVAAFVFGLVLLIAGLIGKEVKIAAIEMPALTRYQRILAALLGMFLVVFGLTDGRLIVPSAAPKGAATATANAASFTNPTPPGIEVAAQPPTAASVPVSGDANQNCFADVPDSSRIIVGIESRRDTDREMSGGQPRDAILAIQFKKDGAIIGGLKFRTFESGVGFDILSVVDAACNPITTYKNISREDQPKEAPYSYDVMNYDFGGTVIAMYLAYSESNGLVHLRARDANP